MRIDIYIYVIVFSRREPIIHLGLACVCVCVWGCICVCMCVCVSVCVCGGGTCVLATFTLYMSHSAILWVVVQKQAAYLPET